MYNALCDTSYTDVNDIQIYTIDNVIYIEMKNDVSILLDSYLHLWEQPRFIKLKLSDAFIHEDKSGDFEWTANMVNINSGRNDKLLNKCRPLQEYMLLIEAIRYNRTRGMDVEKAVDEAVTYCIDHNILCEFLTKHRAEVIDVCITEYDEQAFVNGIKEEGREQGREEGRQEGREEGRVMTIYSLVQSGNLKPLVAAKELGISVKELKSGMEKAGYILVQRDKE